MRGNIMLKNKKNWASAIMLLSAASASGMASANDSSCSYLKLNSDEQSQIRINHLNGSPLFSGGKSYNKWKKATVLKIPAGNHEIVGSIVPTDIVEHENKKPSPDQIKKIAPLYFALDVELGNSYEISVIRKNGAVADIKVIPQANTSCDEVGAFDASGYVKITPKTTVQPNVEQMKLADKFFKTVSLLSQGENIQSIMPAGFNKDLLDSENGQFIPRYQYALNKTNQPIVKYSPITSASKSQLDELIVNLSNSFQSQYDQAQRIELDFASTDLEGKYLVIDIQNQSDYLALQKKNNRIYKKVSKRISRNAPKWWDNEYWGQNEQALYPGGKGEERANNGG